MFSLYNMSPIFVKNFRNDCLGCLFVLDLHQAEVEEVVNA